MCVNLQDDVLRPLRISPRTVSEAKAGLLFAGAGVSPMEAVGELLKGREFRKGLFVQQVERLAQTMVERMEDAEGWHDVERIEPARAQLGGEWRDL